MTSLIWHFHDFINYYTLLIKGVFYNPNAGFGLLGHFIWLFVIFFTQVLGSLSTLYLIYKVFTVL